MAEFVRRYFSVDDHLDFFVYMALTCPRSRKLLQADLAKEYFPPFPWELIHYFRVVVVATMLLVLQVLIPLGVLYQGLTSYMAASGSAASDSGLSIPVMKAAGCVCILAAEIVMLNDFNQLGVTYFAPMRLQTIKGRQVIWFAFGVLCNFLAMAFSEVALVLLFLQTDKLIDFVVNFAALFVLYQVDDFLVTHEMSREIQLYMDDLVDDDIDTNQQFEGWFYNALHRSVLYILLPVKLLSVLIVPVVFAYLY